MKWNVTNHPALLIALMLFMASGNGCRSIYLHAKGVKNPSFQSVQRVRDFLDRHGVPEYDGSFVLKDSASFYEFIRTIRHFPSVSYFTPEGGLIVINDSGYCAGITFDYGVSFTPGQPVVIDTSFSLPELNGLVQPLTQQAKMDTGDADIILVGCWATFLGKINGNVFGTCEAVRKNCEVNSKIYLINTDLMESWGMNTIPVKLY